MQTNIVTLSIYKSLLYRFWFKYTPKYHYPTLMLYKIVFLLVDKFRGRLDVSLFIYLFIC